MSYEPQEKGVPIRQPATANLMIDSADRNGKYTSPFDFQIERNNSIMNGFFSRIGTTEVVLEWNQPNGAKLANTAPNFQILVSTSSGFTSTTIQNLAFSNVFYTASNALDALVGQLDVQFAPNTFAISTVAGTTALAASPGLTFAISTNAYTKALGLDTVSSFVSTFNVADISAPDLRPYRYIDFTSQQLTYNQDLKDNSTANISRDVLCRWYFDYDNPAPLDGYGFPIEMGYEPFKIRRLFNLPKQIKWNPNQPLGNLGFQVYGNGELSPIVPINKPNGSEWLMTLQFSEN